MKIVVYVKEASQLTLLETIATALRKTHPKFEWTTTVNLSEALDSFSTFKIGAFDGTLESVTLDPELCTKAFDLLWPSPSTFLKDPKKKELVWNDIQGKLIGILNQAVTIPKISISSENLQKLLNSITDAKKSFVFNHPDGYSIGVNTTETVDVSLSSGDLASMLAAVWIFGAKGVRIK